MRVTREKLQTIEKLDNLNTKLQLKVDDMIAMRETLQKVRFYISSLEETISPNSRIEDYLISIVTNTSAVGYNQNSLYKMDEGKGSIEIRTKYFGSPNQLPALIKAIESQKRLTKIKNFDYYLREDTAEINVLSEIYYLPD
jgi:hypothetical protein